ncbi:MarR family transcriptional regulator [Streptomyces sp. NPDC018019]|uniref:MarR family transcriptional regulator n=1 Tax=Streptomyces sp. NPDC018019 TaxID=3365030 RepID=UPI003788436B
MADAQLTTAPCAPTASHPLAAPGYGKRSAPDQTRRRPGDFAHLPEREAFLAAFIDRLPDGAAMDVKTLAAAQPRYGQQAVRSALTRLSAAGHLRRLQETVGNGRSQWVYRTYFTRTARDDAWWHHFLTGNPPPQFQPDERPPDPPEPPDLPEPQAPTVPQVRPDRSPPPGRRPLPNPRIPRPPLPPPRRAPYRAAVRKWPPTPTRPHRPARPPTRPWPRSVPPTPRMILSAAECTALEDLAAQWLARGVTSAHLITALTAGLPPEVHSPGALARTRLTGKLPPPPPPTPERTPTRIMECTECGVPGRPEALPGGLCRPCRGDSPPPDPTAEHLQAQRTHHYANLCRTQTRPRA